MSQSLTCIACESAEFVNIRSCVDYTVSHETFTLHECKTCGLSKTFPQPEESEIGKYYASEEYISHSGKLSWIGLIYKLARKYSLRKKRTLIETHVGKGALLDYGCGTGHFLQHMYQNGWKVEGIEPSDKARINSPTDIQRYIQTTLSKTQTPNYQAITLWHVLEHIHDPEKILKDLKQRLTENSIIVIAVPNHKSADANHYGDHWAAYDVPRHLWHFSPESMRALLQKSGFKIADILPMKLDAYYVSILSERYKNNNKLSISSFMKGVIQGLASNRSARQTNQYSSLIYIARLS